MAIRVTIQCFSRFQGPWDALKKAGHQLTLATRFGKKPLPLMLSMDANFVDPVQNTPINPAPIVKRCQEPLDGPDWASPITYEAIRRWRDSADQSEGAHSGLYESLTIDPINR